MAHKTKIGGTIYEISGGNTAIGGTDRAIYSGKTIVEGTVYDVKFGSVNVSFAPVEMNSSTDKAGCITINDEMYYLADGYATPTQTIRVRPGTVITIERSFWTHVLNVIVNDVRKIYASSEPYIYTVPNGVSAVNISADYNYVSQQWQDTVKITES